MDIKNMRIGDYTEQLASDAPAPGGGSVSALCGSIASSLVLMVGNLTVNRETFQANHNKMEEVIEEAEFLRKEFLEMSGRDAEAYWTYIRAIRMPKGTDEEKKARLEAIQKAKHVCIKVPLRVMELCARTTFLAKTVALYGNPNVAPDAGAASVLCEAIVKIAEYNITVNLKGLKDTMFESQCMQKVSIYCESVKKDSDMTEAIVKKLIV